MRLFRQAIEFIQWSCPGKRFRLRRFAATAHIALAVWILTAACSIAATASRKVDASDNAQESLKENSKSNKMKQTESTEKPTTKASSGNLTSPKENMEVEEGKGTSSTKPKQFPPKEKTFAEHDNPILSGDLTLDYRGRWAGKQEDHDLAEYLRFRTNRLYGDKISVAGLLRSTQRLDGKQSKDSLFRDILDTWDHSFNPRVYYLYADINNPLANNSLLRIGRQYIHEHESILIDGVKWAQSLSEGNYYVFGGRRATQYTETDRDAAFGVGFSTAPWLYAKTAVDYARVEDDDFNDDMLSFRLWQGFPEDNLDFYGRTRILNDNPRDLLLTLTWNYPKYDITAQASYFRILTTQKELGNNFTPFYQILGQLSRYQDTELTITKGIGEHLSIFGGFNNRDVIGRDEVDTFNRNYNRFFIGFNITDILMKDLDLDITADYWDTSGSSDRITAISAEIRKKITEKLRVALGTTFSKFKFDIVDDFSLDPIPDEVLNSAFDRVNVRTYYGIINYGVTENSYVRFRFEAENTSDVSPDIYTVGLTFGWSF